MTHGPHPGRRDRAEPLADPARAFEGDVMRTLQLSLAGVMALLVAGGTVGVSAADEVAVEEPTTPPVWVTLTEQQNCSMGSPFEYSTGAGEAKRLRGLSLGCTLMKFFPAGPAGGPEMLKALAGPYASRGVKFCPTGGITLDNMNDYLALPIVAAVGGSWIATKEQIQAKNWPAIARQAEEALARSAQPAGRGS